MQNTPESERNAALIERATGEMLNALLNCGASDNAPVCLAAIGSLMGCMAANMGDPNEALAGMNAVARGIIDGSLLNAEKE